MPEAVARLHVEVVHALVGLVVALAPDDFLLWLGGRRRRRGRAGRPRRPEGGVACRAADVADVAREGTAGEAAGASATAACGADAAPKASAKVDGRPTAPNASSSW